MRSREADFLGFSPSDMLVDRTRGSALPICPITQHTFVWLNCLAEFFKTFSIISFWISFSEALNAVTAAVQLSCL